MPLRKDIGFVHETTGLRIELHWRLFLNPHAMAESSFMTASRVVPLAGTQGLRTLGEEDLFAYLCMHGALHWWNRLKWLADVNALFASTPEDSVEHLVRAADARGAGRAAAQALLLCRRLLGTPLPARLMAALGKSVTARWLEATALNAMTAGQGEHDPHDLRFGTTRGSLSTFLLSRSWRYRLAELSIHLTNQTDVLSLPLPNGCDFSIRSCGCHSGCGVTPNENDAPVASPMPCKRILGVDLTTVDLPPTRTGVDLASIRCESSRAI